MNNDVVEEKSGEVVINVEPYQKEDEMEMQPRSSLKSDIEIEIMQYLLDQNANYKHESTSVYSPTVLHAAARQGNIKFFLTLYEWLSDKYRDNQFVLKTILSIINKGKRTVVHQACRSAQIKFLEALESKLPKREFFKLLRLKDQMYQDNCLHLACTKGNQKLIRKLIKYEISSDLIEEQNSSDRFPLDNFIENLNKNESESIQYISLIQQLCPKKFFNDQSKMFPKCIETCISSNFRRVFETVIKTSLVNSQHDNRNY